MEEATTDLVLCARSGVPEAIEALARRAGTSALRTAAAVLRDREMARDVAQDVALDALRGLARLEDPARFDAWVHRIAVRHTMRAARRRAEQRAAETLLDDLDSPLEPLADADPGMDPDALALRIALARALDTLPARQRLALALRYVHDLTEPEIATALGCRTGTAASLLSRGREVLRRDPGVRDLVLMSPGGPS